MAAVGAGSNLFRLLPSGQPDTAFDDDGFIRTDLFFQLAQAGSDRFVVGNDDGGGNDRLYADDQESGNEDAVADEDREVALVDGFVPVDEGRIDGAVGVEAFYLVAAGGEDLAIGRTSSSTRAGTWTTPASPKLTSGTICASSVRASSDSIRIGALIRPPPPGKCTGVRDSSVARSFLDSLEL